MTQPQDILTRAALSYLATGDKVSCGSMNIDMHLMLSGLVEIAPDVTLRLTDAGKALLAQADRNPKGQDPTEGLGAKHESAVVEDDAPEGSRP